MWYAHRVQQLDLTVLWWRQVSVKIYRPGTIVLIFIGFGQPDTSVTSILAVKLKFEGVSLHLSPGAVRLQITSQVDKGTPLNQITRSDPAV